MGGARHGGCRVLRAGEGALGTQLLPMVATLGTKTSGMRGGWMGHSALEEHIEGGMAIKQE